MKVISTSNPSLLDLACFVYYLLYTGLTNFTSNVDAGVSTFSLGKMVRDIVSVTFYRRNMMYSLIALSVIAVHLCSSQFYRQKKAVLGIV